MLYPRKLTANALKINGWKMHFLLKESLFRGHVNFWGCNAGDDDEIPLGNFM